LPEVPMIYLLVGSDVPAKDAALASLKAQLLSPESREFNYDCLFGRDLTLKLLQEKLLFLPVGAGASRRVVVIKDAASLKDELKEYLTSYVRAPAGHVVLVLEADEVPYRDAFFQALAPKAKRMSFKELRKPDTFYLYRQLEQRKVSEALKVLHQLLQEGEKPERILGGLRYACQKGALQNTVAAEKQMKLLLDCDREIKTGALKAELALEKLVFALSGFAHAAA
jgi:hypothetical protein